jgi:hypothetical protein
MYLAENQIKIIKVLQSLFSEPHMIAFKPFFTIIAPLKLNEKI